MRKNRQFYIIFCVFVLVFSIFCANFLSFGCVNADGFSTSAKGCVVLETSSKRVLFEVCPNKKMPMASTTKILTAITAIENCQDLDEKFVVSKKAIGVPGTSLYLKEGDVYSTRELLYALMLVSGNDASVAIAEHVAGSTSEFVTIMNETAKKIGAKNSHFANTHGLDADGHYTTAYDLALIASYALENETFREIVLTKNIKITNGNGENRYLKNKNKLLFTLDGCIGVKTGFTDDAGRCLVSAVEKDGMRLVCVVLNCGPMFEESTTLLKGLGEQYKIFDLTEIYDFEKSVRVVDGKNVFAEIGTKEHFLYPLSQSEFERLRFVYTIPEFVEAPMGKNEPVGKVEIFLDNNLLFSEKIYTIENIRAKSLLQRVKDFFEDW